MKLEIKNATIDNLEEICTIENQSFNDPWSEDIIKEAIISPVTTVMVAENEENKICGYIFLLIIEDTAELLNIAVKEEYRKVGIACSLMDSGDELLRNQKVELEFLEVRESNIPARLLYNKYGFESYGIRKRYYKNPTEDAILMRRIINQEEIQ